MPLVEAAAGYTRQSNVPELFIAAPGAPPRTIFPNIPDVYTSRLSVSLPLYTGGRLSEQIAAADREKSAAGSDVASATADLVLETREAYWNLVTTMESVKVLAEAVVSYDAHLQDARHRVQFGTAARNELLAVQVERDRAELSRLRAANDVELIHADLLRLLGLPDGTRVAPSEPLTPRESPAGDRASLAREAIEARPERRALLDRIEAAESRIDVARADRWPQVRFNAGYDYARPNRRILPLTDEFHSSWDASVNLSVRLFDGGRVAAAVSQRSAAAESMRKQLEDLERRIRLEVTQRLLDVENAKAAVAVAERNVEAATENARVSRERYGAGVIPSSELLDAEVGLLQASLDRTTSLARQRLAAAALDRATGR
jgi:outer membrane protein TolC